MSATGRTNPFPGLRPFREDEEHLFFGRESQVDAMVDKLAATRFLTVVGSSGSGKSSLVNCGLRPALHRGLMARAGTAWRMAQFRPGGAPLRSMTNALAEDGVLFRDYQAGGLTLAEIVDTTLRMSKRGLVDIYEQAQLDKNVNLLVVVDQFEELFRYRKVAEEQRGRHYGLNDEAIAFVNLLLEAGRQATHPIYVVLTMRSDFLGDCAQFEGLAEAINAGQYLVPRLTRDERRAAISGPVSVGGAEISPVLLTRLVNDVGDNPDQLSILQHALNRTWARWQHEGGAEGQLDIEVYKEIGTMAHALDQHAEKAYAALGTARQRRICERLFKALTDKATDPRGVRRPTALGTLCALADASEEEVEEVMAVFRQPSRSFLMPPVGDELDAETVVDISHESFMRVWRRLNDWADDEADSARRYRRLAETAVLHQAGKANILQGTDLQLALDWRQEQQPTEAWADLYKGRFRTAMGFLRDSKVQRDAQEADKLAKHRYRRTVQVGLLLAALAAILGTWYQRAQALEWEQQQAEWQQRDREFADDALHRIYETVNEDGLVGLNTSEMTGLTEELSYKAFEHSEILDELFRYGGLQEQDHLLDQIYHSVEEYGAADRQDPGDRGNLRPTKGTVDPKERQTKEGDREPVSVRSPELEGARQALSFLIDEYPDAAQTRLARDKVEQTLAKQALHELFRYYERHEGTFFPPRIQEDVWNLQAELVTYDTGHDAVASALPESPQLEGEARLLAQVYGCFERPGSVERAFAQLRSRFQESVHFRLAREALQLEDQSPHSLPTKPLLLTLLALPIWLVGRWVWRRLRKRPAGTVDDSVRADPLRRAAAGTTDVVVAALLGALAGLAGLLLGDPGSASLLFVLVPSTYLLFRDAVVSGFRLSLGKRLFKLLPVTLDEQPLTIKGTVKRNWPLALMLGLAGALFLFDAVDYDFNQLGSDIAPDGTATYVGLGLVGLFLVVELSSFFRRDGRTWRDRLAGTRVLDRRELTEGGEERPSADPLRRAAAGAVDIVVAAIVGAFSAYLVALSAGFVAVFMGVSGIRGVFAVSFMIVLFLASGGYLLVRDGIAYRFRRSIGKIVCRLLPVTLDGRPLTMKVSLKRNWPLLVMIWLPVALYALDKADADYAMFGVDVVPDGTAALAGGVLLFCFLTFEFVSLFRKGGGSVRDRLGKTRVIDVWRCPPTDAEEAWEVAANAPGAAASP